MKFAGRQKELERLEKLFRSRSGGLAVVWGRRRVGKTRLLLHWVEKKKGVYFVADESSASILLPPDVRLVDAKEVIAALG